MKRLTTFILSFVLTMNLMAQNLSNNIVSVTFNDTTASVVVADNISQYITTTINGAHVSIAQSSDVSEEITYRLSGTSNDGEFYMSGSYKATIELNGLNLTNLNPVNSGAAIHIENSKRIKVKILDGTTNSLVDAASGSQKGCFYVKGHPEFSQSGTLNVIGNKKHAIKSGEYLSLKDATINVTSAQGDGISCNQYFLMESGVVNISGTTDDGLQCDLDGDSSTGIIEDHEDEDSGNIYISGGNITINCPGIAAKGIKSEGDIYLSDECVINVTTTGNGRWDEEDLETSAACGLSADGNITISGGNITLVATGSGGKGLKCDGILTVSGGNLSAETSGALYYNNGTTENLNYTGNTDNVDNAYYSSPKAIRVGVKTENGNSYTYSGGIVISGGVIKARTSGTNAEGIESKNTLEISGGEIYVDAYDDGINSGQDMTITNGYVYSRSANNDAIDANGDVYINGGLVYAIGSRAPEVAIDANSEEGKRLFLNGGVVISIGGLEQGASLSQACYQSSTVNSETWYSMSYGNEVIAFYVPTISSGGFPGGFSGKGPGGPGGPGGGPSGGNSSGLIVSAPSTPTIMSGVTVDGGNSIFEDNCYLNAIINGGSAVTMTNYGNSGGGNNSLEDFDIMNITIRNLNGEIIVEGCENCELKIYDIEGRLVSNSNLTSGVYIVKVGNYPAQKIVITE
ncbi:MAG: carbohydrate-binding domain-containing protein [Bacteroidales bacterium]|nr:carbohydrate-binding domain-containing protein [Bacteroidales bacterium]MEE1143404.1 carbohydrate-binding domain-containing protein [Bacteroidales bacterium]